MRRSVQRLQDGGWEGRGSAAFYAEMSEKVFPATQRLADALRQAQKVTLQISQVLQAAEEDAARPFRGSTEAEPTGGGCGTPWWENNRAKDRPFSIRNIGPGGKYGQGEVPLGDHMVSVYLPPTVRTYQNSEGLLPLYEPKYGLATQTSYAPEHDVEDYWWGDEVPGKNAVQPNQWQRVMNQHRVEGPNVQELVGGIGRGLAGIPASLELSPGPTRGEVAANALIVGANVANGLAGSGWESTFVLQVNPATGEYRVIILSRPGYADEQFYRTFQDLHVINWGPETIGRRR